jgi:site-specific DNA recombinase
VHTLLPEVVGVLPPGQQRVSLSIAIYLRVSTEEQAKTGYSLPGQREACRRKAEALVAEHGATGGTGPVEVVEFVDDFGGDIADRPVLEELREFVRLRRPAWLVCMDPDRFSRSLKLQLIVADDIEAQGTRLCFVQQDYNPDDLMSRAFFQFRGLMSELDKAKILERTTRGKRGKIKAGRRPNGAAPYGYIHQKETDELVIYEPEAQWVRRIYAWAAHEQMGVHGAAKRLNELGVPTKRNGGRWHRSVVRDLLRNTTYYGAMRCNRKDFRGLGAVRRLPPGKRKPLSARLRPESEWVTVPVPAIISRELWELAQAALATTTRRGGRRDTGLLSMLVRCGECGGRMVYARHGGGRQYLRCQRRYGRPGDGGPGAPRCGCPHLRAEQVEAQVWGRLVAWLTDPELVGQYLEEEARFPGHGEVLSRLEQEQRAVQARLEAEHEVQAVVVRRQAQGRLAEGAADRLLQQSNRVVGQLQGELAVLEQRAAALRAGQARSAAAGADRLETAVVRTREQLAALGPEGRRALAVRVIQHVVAAGDGTATVVLQEV